MLLRLKFLWVLPLTISLLFSGCVTQPKATAANYLKSKESINVKELSLPGIGISKVNLKMKPGTEIGHHHGGLMNIKMNKYTTKPQLNPADQVSFVSSMNQELINAGYKVVGIESLFEERKLDDARFLIGGEITSVSYNTYSSAAGNHSEADYKINWKVYDKNTLKEFFEIHTNGRAWRKGIDSAVEIDAIMVAFSNLLAEQKFVDALKKASGK